MIPNHLINNLSLMGDHTALDDFIFEIQNEFFLFRIPEFIDKIVEIRRKHLAGGKALASGGAGKGADPGNVGAAAPWRHPVLSARTTGARAKAMGRAGHGHGGGAVAGAAR